MSAVDPLDEAERGRYQAGVRHGIRLMLDGKPLENLALELTMLRAAYEAACVELAKRERTIAAYRTICRGG